MEKKERVINIDILKGLGILLVMYYHSAPHFPKDLTTDTLVSTISFIINSFFMQLFFFCSGFLMIITDRKELNKEYFTRRFVRLMIPYYIFALLSVVLRVLLGTITRSDINFLEGILNIILYSKYYWFLFVLFVITVLFKIIRYYTDKVYVWIVFGLFMSLFAYIKPIEYFHIDRICFFTFYFVFGALFAVFRDKFISLKKYSKLIIITCLYFISLYLMFRQNKDSGVIYFIIKNVVSVFAILSLYSISFHISNKNVLTFLQYFSRFSLQYYLLHLLVGLPVYYFVLLLDFPFPIISVMLIFGLLILFSFVCLRIASHIPYSYIILGLKKNEK